MGVCLSSFILYPSVNVSPPHSPTPAPAHPAPPCLVNLRTCLSYLSGLGFPLAPLKTPLLNLLNRAPPPDPPTPLQQAGLTLLCLDSGHVAIGPRAFPRLCSPPGAHKPPVFPVFLPLQIHIRESQWRPGKKSFFKGKSLWTSAISANSS